ncbi:hypothetical protein CFP56_032968 [Quercus suber]|uniref:Uncharacterized protein n=1 Tax=Quercus suber TaxID=58331 RepID=A0AAW0JHS6_QUESU
MGYHGSPFTWSNQRDGDELVFARLNRGVGNPEWLQKFQEAKIFHVSTITSDHALLILKTNGASN